MQTVQVNKLYVCAHVDPAGGPSSSYKRGPRSRSSIAVVGVDDLERVFILETWAQRIAPDQLIDRIFETQERWRPAVFGIDKSGPQLQFYQLLLKEARERGVKWAPREIALRNDKDFMIEGALQPVSSSGRLLRPVEKECYALADEWRNFPGMYRDALDALANAIRLLPSILPSHLKMLSDRQLREYLIRTGLPPDMVESRLQQRVQFAK